MELRRLKLTSYKSLWSDDTPDIVRRGLQSYNIVLQWHRTDGANVKFYGSIMNGGSSNYIKCLMYVRCLDVNTKSQTKIKKDPSHMDLYQHTRCRSHVDSYKMIHSHNGHSVTVPFQLHY